MIKYPPRSTASTTPNLITKREVLQESSKIYDPIGFLGPVTVRAKILMQELWRQGIAWDEPLPPDLQMKWKELATELETIMSIAIPRQYFPLSSTWPNDVELHVFVDASHQGLWNCCLSQFLTRKLLLLRDGKIASCSNKGTNPTTVRANCSCDRCSTCLSPPRSASFEQSLSLV